MMTTRLLPVLMVALVSCSSPSTDSLQRTVSTRASPGSFQAAGVTTVFERRCGSLDCHGNIGRNMRIYSGRGLRLPNDAGLAPGAGDTSLDEISANYQSILTVEPEQTNKVISGNDDPHTLLIVKKPLGIESHKGGQTIRQGDDAETCIVSWLKEDPATAPVNKDACTAAAIFPKE
jgi:hypothetical protein